MNDNAVISHDQDGVAVAANNGQTLDKVAAEITKVYGNQKLADVAPKLTTSNSMQALLSGRPDLAHNVAETGDKMTNNQAWTSLNSLANDIWAMLGQFASVPLIARNDPELQKYLPDPGRFVAFVRQMTTDVGVLSNEWNAINSQHAGLTGDADDIQQFLETTRIHEQYIGLSSRMMAVVQPTALEITGMIDHANVLRANANQQTIQPVNAAEAVLAEVENTIDEAK